MARKQLLDRLHRFHHFHLFQVKMHDAVDEKRKTARDQKSPDEALRMNFSSEHDHIHFAGQSDR
jgi:hypothetical protein